MVVLMNHNLKDYLQQPLAYIKAQTNRQTHMRISLIQFESVYE